MTPVTRLLIDEHLVGDGAPVRTWLEDGAIRRGDEPALRLPAGAIAAVMRRYGRPLEDGIEYVLVEEVAIDGGALRRIQFRAAVDAASRDWLVWIAPDTEPLAALATMIAAPLVHLAARVGRAT
jgi:hypothetical protein